MASNIPQKPSWEVMRFFCDIVSDEIRRSYQTYTPPVERRVREHDYRVQQVQRWLQTFIEDRIEAYEGQSNQAAEKIKAACWNPAVKEQFARLCKQRWISWGKDDPNYLGFALNIIAEAARVHKQGKYRCASSWGSRKVAVCGYESDVQEWRRKWLSLKKKAPCLDCSWQCRELVELRIVISEIRARKHSLARLRNSERRIRKTVQDIKNRLLAPGFQELEALVRGGGYDNARFILSKRNIRIRDLNRSNSQQTAQSFTNAIVIANSQKIIDGRGREWSHDKLTIGRDYVHGTYHE